VYTTPTDSPDEGPRKIFQDIIPSIASATSRLSPPSQSTS